MQIGIAIKPGIAAPQNLIDSVCEWAAAHGHEVVLEATAAKLSPRCRARAIEVAELVGESHWVLSLGGDGTLIWLARYVRGDGPVFVGVHFGTFGFLTDIQEPEVLEVLQALHEGRFKVERRGTLCTRLTRGGEEIFSSAVINDVVVQKGSHGRLVEIDLVIDGEHVTCVRADGLIVATPTGSTAYSLSAGGSLIHPSLPVTLITPICAHSLTHRPLVIGMDSRVELVIPDGNDESFLVVDGQEMVALKPHDKVSIERNSHSIRFFQNPSRSFFERLRSKLKWG